MDKENNAVESFCYIKLHQNSPKFNRFSCSFVAVESHTVVAVVVERITMNFLLLSLGHAWDHLKIYLKVCLLKRNKKSNKTLSEIKIICELL